jgi:hypothetical protein
MMSIFFNVVLNPESSNILEQLAAPVSPPLLCNLSRFFSPPEEIPEEPARIKASRFTRYRTSETTRDTQIQIQAALKLEVSHQKIRETFNVTENQIQHAHKNPTTPQKKRSGRKSILHTPRC